MSVRISFGPRLMDKVERGDDGQPVRRDLAPGSASWSTGSDGRIATLNFVCPCGCGVVGVLPVRAGFNSDDRHWKWDGNRDRPTLAESIHKSSQCHWHGYLTAGEFIAIN